MNKTNARLLLVGDSGAALAPQIADDTLV